MRTDTAQEGTTAIGSPDRWPRWRIWAIRVWYGLLSLWALSLARGVVSLALGRADPDDHFGSATVTAWKLLATGAVLVIFWTGGRSVVAFQALAVGSIGWALSEQLWAVRPADSSPFASAIATVVLWFLPLLLLRPDRQQLRHLRAHPSAMLLPLALAAAVPLMIYSVHQGGLASDSGGVDGGAYDRTALGVVLAVQAVFAALRPAHSRWLPRLIALAATWVGLAAVLWPDDLGSLGLGWGVTLIGWGLAFAAAAEVETRRDPSTAFPDGRAVMKH